MKTESKQLGLLDWEAPAAAHVQPHSARPTARVVSIIPGLARRMWRERFMTPPHNEPHVVSFRRRA